MEPMEISGGPFDLKVLRNNNVISLVVEGKHGDTITRIAFRAERIDTVIQALREVQ